MRYWAWSSWFLSARLFVQKQPSPKSTMAAPQATRTTFHTPRAGTRSLLEYKHERTALADLRCGRFARLLNLCVDVLQGLDRNRIKNRSVFRATSYRGEIIPNKTNCDLTFAPANRQHRRNPSTVQANAQVCCTRASRFRFCNASGPTLGWFAKVGVPVAVDSPKYPTYLARTLEVFSPFT
jgi:hypothetical protein